MPRPIHKGSTYLPALDGLRALAVGFVVLYHLRVPGFSSGLLGVGVFFTLSGFLITSLLLSTRARTGGFELKRFWLARARRLLPAVLLVMVTSLVAVAVAMPENLAKYSWQALSAVFYVNNWFTIGSSESYFDRFGGPGPFDHLWSLSIEEQFYLLWPLVLLGLLTVLRKRIWVTLAIVVLAIVSFSLLSGLAHAGFDNTRAYEGTDTRAGGLLLGAALAFWWPARARRVSHNQRCAIDVAALAGLALVVYLVATTPDGALSLYKGDILWLTIATLAVLVATVVPDTLVATLLSMAPLRWIGERSYGIYLWHMPIIAFVPAAFRTQNPVATGAVVILSTLVLSALSWRYVEDPIRRHGFGKAFTTPRDPEDTLMNHLLAWLITTTTRFADWLTRLQARRETALSASNSGSPMAPTETPPPESPARESPARRASTADGDVTPEVANTAAPTPIEVEVATDLTATDLDVTDETTATDPTDVALPIYVEAALEHSRPPEPLTTEPAIPTITIPAVAVPTDGASVAATTTHPWRRRSNLVTSIVAVVALAVTGLLGLTALRSSDPQTLDTASLSEELPTTTSTGVPTGPTLPVTQRKTRCSTVIHIGDSTSIGMNDPDTLPDPATRIIGRYRQVGAQNVITDIVGARSSLETVNGQPNAVTAINGHLARGERGCWVMAMGINDTANIEVGGPGPDDMRIDRLLGPLRNQPVMWPTVITSPLNQNPAYANDAMQRFDRALLRACKRYPNLRLYNWAAEARPDWFSDGIHYTAAGYTQRAYRFAIALASVFPARDAPPKGCLLQTSGVVGVPPSPTPSPGPTSTAPRQG